MKLTFLGTGSAEMYPAPFCDCPHCTQARQEGGKSIRANSSALVDGDILIDMNGTCEYVAARLGMSLAGVRHVLVTHAHPDHFAPDRLRWRRAGRTGVPPFDPASMVWSARYSRGPEMIIHGNRFVQAALEQVLSPERLASAAYDMRFALIVEGREERWEDFSFLPVRANHGDEPGMTHSYILRRGGKTLLYALDTGGYDEDQLALLARENLDCVVMEGTFGLRPCPDDGLPRPTGQGHMNLRKNRTLRRFLLENGCIGGDTPCILSHFCPHYTPPHSEYVPMVAGEGFIAAYDGMSIEI